MLVGVFCNKGIQEKIEHLTPEMLSTAIAALSKSNLDTLHNVDCTLYFF